MSAYDFSRITPKFTILKIPTKPKLIILKTKYENVDPKTKTKSFAKSITNKTKKKAPRYEKQYKNKSRQAIHHQTVLKPQPQQSVRIQHNPILEQPPYEEAKFDKKMARTAKPRLQNRSKRIKKRGLTE